jgi:DNA-binding response OmpR family regulator
MKNSEMAPTNDLPARASDSYRFGHFVLDRRRRTLSRAGSPVFLTPKAFDVLTFLVQNPNRLVTKEELLQAVWGDTFVEEGNLTQYIFPRTQGAGRQLGRHSIDRDHCSKGIPICRRCRFF